MKSALLLAAPLVLGLALVSADAHAFSRSGSTTGPGGRTTSYSGSATCANGACASQTTRTGPNGASATRSAGTTCANGSCTRTMQRTGPNGATGGRTGTVSRY